MISYRSLLLSTIVLNDGDYLIYFFRDIINQQNIYYAVASSRLFQMHNLMLMNFEMEGTINQIQQLPLQTNRELLALTLEMSFQQNT